MHEWGMPCDSGQTVYTHGKLYVSGSTCMNGGCLVIVGRQHPHGRLYISGPTCMNGGCLVTVGR